VSPKGNANDRIRAEAQPLPRVERLLAMLLLGQQPNATLWEKIKLLRAAGLTNPAIGEILGMSGSAVGKTFYDATKRSVPKKLKKGK
jgi:hypothetical protein